MRRRYRFWLSLSDDLIDICAIPGDVSELTSNLLQCRRALVRWSCWLRWRLLRWFYLLGSVRASCARLARSEAHARIDLPPQTGRVVDVEDVRALIDIAVGSHEIFVKRLADSRPAGLFPGALSLLDEIFQRCVALLLDKVDILEEAFSLLRQYSWGQLWCRLGTLNRRVKSVEHGNAVVFGKRNKHELVQKDL